MGANYTKSMAYVNEPEWNTKATPLEKYAILFLIFITAASTLMLCTGGLIPVVPRPAIE